MTKEDVLSKLKDSDYSVFSKLSTEKYYSNKSFWMDIVKYPKTIVHAGEEIKADREIAYEAIKNDNQSIFDISDKLKADKEFILNSIKIINKLFPLCYASKELRADKDFVDEAIKNSPWASKFTKEELELGVCRLNPTYSAKKIHPTKIEIKNS